MSENFEEMYQGVYQPDPQSEVMVSALKELKRLTEANEALRERVRQLEAMLESLAWET